MMKNILIINGHEYFSFAKGDLNRTISLTMVEKLGKKYNVKTTVVQAGYDIKEEQEKFQWADTVIIQTPVYWYSYPGLFKKYIDAVYEQEIFYRSGKVYGTNGLFSDKKYMLSVTWAAEEDLFSNEKTFFDGKSMDDVLVAMHKNQQFVGMKPLKTLSTHQALNPNIDECLKKVNEHLKEVFSV
ncbi:MAG: NAD(P)H-dependent oxidoreductase [Paenibacillaceae bacterium]